MFKLEPDASFTWNVKFKWPEEGEHVDKSFKAKFRRMTTDEFMEATKKVIVAETTDGETAIPEIRTVMKDVLLDFSDIEFEGGDREAVKEFLLNDPAILVSLYAGYNSAILGRELSVKNLEAPQDD